MLSFGQHCLSSLVRRCRRPVKVSAVLSVDVLLLPAHVHAYMYTYMQGRHRARRLVLPMRVRVSGIYMVYTHGVHFTTTLQRCTCTCLPGGSLRIIMGTRVGTM